jgi:hypothetical protein
MAVGCELSELGAVGDGKHLKLAVSADGARSGAIAFGQGGQLDRFRRVGRYDVAFRLAANRWNGTVAPQLQVKRIFETPAGYEGLRARLVREWRLESGARSAEAQAIFAELGLDDDPDGRRHLVESQTFCALLHEPVPLAA